MSEETKPPTTTDAVTEQDKGRCAPAPGSAARLIAELVSRSVETFYYARAYEDLRNNPKDVRDRYEKWLKGRIAQILEAPPNAEVSSGAKTP